VLLIHHTNVTNWLYIKQVILIMCNLWMECLEKAASCKKVTQEQRNHFIKAGTKTDHPETVSERRQHPGLAV